MKYIDLHVHSKASDGTMSPKEIVALAVEKNLSAIALTDHDSISGVHEALQAAKDFQSAGTSIRMIPGVEISAAHGKSDIHIVGLFIDPDCPHFTKCLSEARSERNRRNEKMAANLRAAGVAITIEELKAENKDAVLTRAHFAKLLYKKGYVKSVKDAFNRYLDDKGPYFVPREYISPEGAISLIREAGGISILAHPLLYKLNEREITTLVKHLKEAGLDGLEVLYSANINNDEAYARSLAKKYDLLLSGGSDFHGAVKPDIGLGSGRGNLRVPEEFLIPMEQRKQNLQR